MLNIRVLLIIAVLAAAAFAQDPLTLATSSLRNFTAADLSEQSRKAWEQRDSSFKKAREQLLNQMVTDVILDLEAKANGTTAINLLDKQKGKIVDPTEDAI